MQIDEFPADIPLAPDTESRTHSPAERLKP
jgi:hypothetical protein